MLKRSQVASLMLILALTTACAIHRVSQVSLETQWRLNTASQLSQANKDYVTFFKDAGDAQRAGQLDQGQMDALFSVGHNLETALEIANQEWAAYISGTGTKAAVIAAILKAEEIMLQLTSQRSKMGVKL